MSELAASAIDPSTAVSEVARLPDQTEQEAHQFIEQLWRFFCSLRLTLANLLLLFLGMIAGTFVNPANDSLVNIEKAFAGRIWILRAYRYFELYDLFHSWWFTLLLTSLALNLVACSLERLPRIWFLVRYPEKRLDKVKGVRFRGSGDFAGESAAMLSKVEGALKQRRYSIERQPDEGDGSIRLFAEKSRYARFGVWVVHLSLLCVLGGGVFGRLTAFEGVADVPQGGGESDSFLVRLPDGSQFKKKLIDGSNGQPFIVKCDDFRLKEFEPGRPKAFESDLRLLKKLPDGSEGPELARQTINVNHPLKYGGLTFYQASYRQLDEQQRARITYVDKASGEKHDLLVAPGEPIAAADGLRYQVVDYATDFAGQGPAVQVVRTEFAPGEPIPPGRLPPDARLSTFWVFNKAPLFDFANRDDRFAFSFDKLTTVYATGLQIARDPSTPVVYLGCFLLFAGIAVAFYGAHKRVWVKLDAGRLALAGASHRNADAFSEEFAELCNALEVPIAAPRRAAPPAAAATPA